MGEVGRMNTQQADGGAGLPILEKQRADGGKDFGVDARGVGRGVRASNGAEVGISQLELERVRQETVLAQAASYHFRKACERRFKFLRIGSVAVEGVLVTDRLCSPLLADFARKPCARIFAVSFALEGRSPFSEAFFERGLVHALQIANAHDAHLVESCLGYFADSGNLTDIKRSQKCLLSSWQDVEDSVGLGLVGTHLGHQPRAANADGTIQSCALFHLLMKPVG